MKTFFVLVALVLAIALADDTSDRYVQVQKELAELREKIESDPSEENSKAYDEKYAEGLKIHAELLQSSLDSADEGDKAYLEKSLELNGIMQQLHGGEDSDDLREAYDKVFAELTALRGEDSE